MLRDVTLKTLFDQRRSLTAWLVSVVLLVGMYAAIWPSVRDQPSMKDFLDQMPDTFRALFAAAGADMSTPTGYVQVELLSFMAPLVVLLYAVVAGAGAVAGEEDRHTLDLLLANPISRSRIVWQKLAAMALGVTLLVTTTGLALLLEGAPAGLRLPAGRVAAAMLHLGLLGLVFGSLALAVGAATGHAALSRALPVVVAVVAYVVNGLGGVVSWLAPVQKISPFYQYLGHDPLRTGVSWPAVVVAVGTVLALAAVAHVAFDRRDVTA